MARESSLAPASTLFPWEWQAVRIAAKSADKYRDALEPKMGVEIDFTARFRGLVDHSRGQTVQVKQLPKTADLLALVLLAIGPRARKRVLSDLRSQANDASATVFPSETVAEVEDLLAAFTRQVPQDRSGAITGRIDVFRV